MALIPARGGSKGVLRKNLRPVGGRPLLAHTVAAALEAETLDRVVLSTDDDEIAALGRSLGVEVPFLRPAPLATDDAPMLGVLQHALGWCDAEGVDAEVLVLLQPTSPLRRAADIDGTIRLLLQGPADTVVTVVAVPHQFTPTSLMRLSDSKLVPYLGSDLAPVTRRQDKERLFARNGPAVLAVRADVVRSGRLYGDHVAGYEMPVVQSLDVDDEHDLTIANALLAE